MIKVDDDTIEKKIITRAEAKALGLSRYFTGKPCKNGHLVERYVNTGACIGCLQKYIRKYKIENPERIREINKKHRDKTKDIRNKKQRDVRKLNLEKRREQERLWRKNNQLKVKAKRAAGKARKRNAEGRYTADDILKMLEEQKRKCNWCGVCIRYNHHVDHIKPLSKGGSNWPSNLQLLCAPCNLSKSDKDMEEWALEQMW